MVKWDKPETALPTNQTIRFHVLSNPKMKGGKGLHSNTRPRLHRGPCRRPSEITNISCQQRNYPLKPVPRVKFQWVDNGTTCACTSREYRVKRNLHKEAIVLHCCSRKWPCWILLAFGSRTVALSTQLYLIVLLWVTETRFLMSQIPAFVSRCHSTWLRSLYSDSGLTGDLHLSVLRLWQFALAVCLGLWSSFGQEQLRLSPLVSSGADGDTEELPGPLRRDLGLGVSFPLLLLAQTSPDNLPSE
ncbi:hypothetical protein QQF64_025252 [Cirrhinus molitorella]|uniref:Uncharacterized protein n=1 Tax=Cirrhinus molitorella TaxID=172907 RepID=A0ABR3NNJ4_9TELE